MDKSAIDTPSREIEWRALEFEARCSSAQVGRRSGAVRRAAAGHRGRVLRRPPHPRAATRGALVGRGWRRGERPSVRHLPRRMRSDGLETVNVRTSRGTTVPVTTPYYREKHDRRAKRRPGLWTPPWWCWASTTGCTKLASDASRVAMLSSLADGAAPLRRHRPGCDLRVDRLSLRCAGTERRRARRGAGPRDREAGLVVWPLDGGRVRVRRKKRGPKTKKGRNRFHTPTGSRSWYVVETTGDRLRRGPRSSTARSGDRRRSSPCCCRTRGRSASTPLTRCSSSPTARPGSGNASSASSPRSGSRRHRCWG